MGAPYNYEYNGKELQETGMYDYGWRMYMPDIARWNGMDQLSEKFHNASPYAYVMNNPVSFLDPDGRDMAPWLKGMWDATNKTNGNSTFWTNIGSGFQGNFSNDQGLYGTVDYQGIFYYTIQEVLIPARGNRDNWNCGSNLAFNQRSMEVGLLRALKKWNHDVNFSNYHSQTTSPIEDLQTTMDVLGYVPIIGDVLDMSNSFISLGRGDYVGAVASAIAIIPIVGSPAKGIVKNALKPLGLGSTGRTVAKNLVEEMAMKEVTTNPNIASRLMEGMNDPRWLGWTKMEYKVKTEQGINAVVHFMGKWENDVLKAVDDFKFK